MTSSHLLDGLIGAFVGAAVSAGALLFAQWRQHVKEGTGAVRALLVEMMGNAGTALLVAETAEELAQANNPRPADDSKALDRSETEKIILQRYSACVWSEQKPLLADRLPWPTLRLCMKAYSYASTYFYSIASSADAFQQRRGAFATSADKFIKAVESICQSHKWVNGRLIRRAERAEFDKHRRDMQQRARTILHKYSLGQ